MIGTAGARINRLYDVDYPQKYRKIYLAVYCPRLPSCLHSLSARNDPVSFAQGEIPCSSLSSSLPCLRLP
jgi:hypothetical protein